MRYEHAESDYAEDDLETRVYFDPQGEATDPGPPTMLPDPLATVAYERASVRTFDAGKLERWQVPTLAAPVLPHMAPTAVEPPVIVAPELAAQKPWPIYVPAYPRVEGVQADRTVRAYAPRPSHDSTHPVQRVVRPARGVVFAIGCVLVGIAIGGTIAITSSSHGKANAAPVQIAALPAPAPTQAMTVTPIAEPPVPVAAPPVAEPEKSAAPQQVEARTRPRHAAPVEHAPAEEPADDEPNAPDAQGTLELSSKPPCAIVIDGKPTGFMTPKRGIELSAGTHQVTLTNTDEGIQLTTEVEIFAGDSTRLVKDFTK